MERDDGARMVELTIGDVILCEEVGPEVKKVADNASYRRQIGGIAHEIALQAHQSMRVYPITSSIHTRALSDWQAINRGVSPLLGMYYADRPWVTGDALDLHRALFARPVPRLVPEHTRDAVRMLERIVGIHGQRIEEAQKPTAMLELQMTLSTALGDAVRGVVALVRSRR